MEPSTLAATGANSTLDMYNISRAALHSMYTFPARFLARMRKIDDLLNMEAERQAALLASTPPPPGNATRSALMMPGPWGFITSWYALGLFLMAIIMNRVQNLVVPPPPPPTYQRHRRRSPSARAWFSALFPLDLSSTWTRLVLRLPSLFFLSKALLLFALITIQAADLYPQPSLTWIPVVGSSLQTFIGDPIHRLGNWSAQKEFADISWLAFASVCGAICVATLMRGLAGEPNPAAGSFNLFGYAFVLHIYSSPMTHVKMVPSPTGSGLPEPELAPPSAPDPFITLAPTPLGMPTRPDAHILLTLLFPLLLLWIVHAQGCSKRLAHRRLAPSGFVALLTLAHFWGTLLAGGTYPALNYVPCALETGLLALVALTVGLRALGALVTGAGGAWARPVHEDMLPRAEDDFGVALMRLATACLEASAVAGLGNELAGVVAPPAYMSAFATWWDGDAEEKDTGAPVVEVGRGGAVVSPSKRKGAKGLGNEIKDVRGKAAGETTGATVWVDAKWYGALARLLFAVWACTKGVWGLLRGRRPAAREEEAEAEEPAGSEAEEETGERDVYERWLRGEYAEVEEDEDEFVPRAHSEAPDSGSEDENADENAEAETVRLYADHLRGATPARSSMLLAHMTASGASPLTRRRFRGLRAEDPDMDWVLQKRAAAVRDADREAEARMCVVCTVTPRDVICWPCRCLALCDDCRANLASRASAHSHSCPCCRRTVEGYSKIYVP